MLPAEPLTFRQFCQSVAELDFHIHFKFVKHLVGHDYILIFCTNGSLIAQVCTCCVGNFRINDYAGFKQYVSHDQYDQLTDLVLDYTMTDPEDKDYQ